MNKILFFFSVQFYLARPLEAQLVPERPLPGQISSQDAHTALDNFDRLPENIKTSTSHLPTGYFTYTDYINHSTKFKDLERIKRNSFKRYGINIDYDSLVFDNRGLTAIVIEVKEWN